jgi:hypothetical protein
MLIVSLTPVELLSGIYKDEARVSQYRYVSGGAGVLVGVGLGVGVGVGVLADRLMRGRKTTALSSGMRIPSVGVAPVVH